MDTPNQHQPDQQPGLAALEPLLHQLATLLAQALAPRLAAELANTQQRSGGAPSRRLLTLDEFVALLPAGKKPTTWKAWLYARTRLGQVAGCHKLGGRLYFDPDLTLPWLLESAPGGQRRPGLDLPGNQSLHGHSMPDEATQPPTRGGER